MKLFPKGSDWHLPAAGLLILLHAGFAWGTEYTWNAPTGSLPAGWAGSSNWSPSTGYPQITGDSAVFTDTSVRSCNLSSEAVVLDTLDLQSSYTGTLSVTGSGTINATTVTVAGGTLNGGTGNVVATDQLTLLGGSVADATCAGTADTSGSASIGTLRMTGAGGILNGAPLPGTVLDSLLVASGQTIVDRSVVAATLSVANGAALKLGTGSFLATTAHSLQGDVTLSSGSAFSFVVNADIPSGVTFDAASSGTVVTCGGNWSCLGTWPATGNLSNILRINQDTNGTTIDHGSNAADSVTVKNAPGRTSTWTSSNTVGELTVGTSTTLSVSGTLTVSGAIANLGEIIESPGVIRHAADSLEVIGSAADTGVASIQAGESFRVRLRDADEALSASLADSAGGLLITNLRNSDSVLVSATETSGSSTIFVTVSIATEHASAAVADSLLQVLDGDTLSATYTDDEDSTDNAAAASLNISGVVPITLSRFGVE